MDLLEKFDTVVIETDSRISELDKEYCDAHQNAYDDARAMLAELKIIWETMLTSQKEKLEAEGHIVIQKGRKNIRYYVKDYEDNAYRL